MAIYKAALLRPAHSPTLLVRRATSRRFTIALPSLHSIVSSAPSSLASIFVPSLSTTIWADVWESILRAVPKKKTSHSKKRSRFLAGKALKDVTNLNHCSGCGNVKRAHLLCPYCVKGRFHHSLDLDLELKHYIEIRDMWRKQSENAETAMKG